MPPSLPIALTIAGSDSGGGAGIQADLKTFAALRVHGTTVITCVTAQNPRAVSKVQPCTPKMVRAQIEAVFAELRPAAIKTGMLYSSAIVREVADFFQNERRVPLVVDPVMIATSGRPLLDAAGIRLVQKRLLPLATLVTPNLPEADVLIQGNIRSLEDLRAATRVIHQTFGCATLVKGGHLPGMREAVDFFYDGKTEWMLTAPFVRKVRTHGTGCTYSAAITGHLATGRPLPDAVRLAKDYITRAIANSQCAAGHDVLGPHTPRLKMGSR
jgi:hydroxymethylpyrimidine/phosphomethylpyrimidine kinase